MKTHPQHIIHLERSLWTLTLILNGYTYSKMMFGMLLRHHISKLPSGSYDIEVEDFTPLESALRFVLHEKNYVEGDQ